MFDDNLRFWIKPFQLTDELDAILRVSFRMVEEKHPAFEREFGFCSASVPSREYLTPEVLDDLARELRLRWEIHKPWYGLSWTLRPMTARLMRRREPSKFYLLHARMGN
jgi:hypothetical protein